MQLHFSLSIGSFASHRLLAVLMLRTKFFWKGFISVNIKPWGLWGTTRWGETLRLVGSSGSSSAECWYDLPACFCWRLLLCYTDVSCCGIFCYASNSPWSEHAIEHETEFKNRELWTMLWLSNVNYYWYPFCTICFRLSSFSCLSPLHYCRWHSNCQAGVPRCRHRGLVDSAWSLLLLTLVLGLLLRQSFSRPSQFSEKHIEQWQTSRYIILNCRAHSGFYGFLKSLTWNMKSSTTRGMRKASAPSIRYTR